MLNLMAISHKHAALISKSTSDSSKPLAVLLNAESFVYEIEKGVRVSSNSRASKSYQHLDTGLFFTELFNKLLPFKI